MGSIWDRSVPVRMTVFEDVDMSLIGNCGCIRRNMGGCSGDLVKLGCTVWISGVVDHFLLIGTDIEMEAHTLRADGVDT